VSVAWAPTWPAVSRTAATKSPRSTTRTPLPPPSSPRKSAPRHAKTLAAVTAAADVIFTVVTDDAAQLASLPRPATRCCEGAKGKVFVNCATLTPKTHVEVERRAKRAGAVTLEGCMASSIPQARNGTLYLMCGGEKKTFDRIKPILEKLSTALRYIGKTGQAAQVKALVNMVMNINTAGLAEGLGLGAALGLDLNMLREVFPANRRQLPGPQDRRRGHAEPRPRLLLLRRPRRQGLDDRLGPRRRGRHQRCRSPARPSSSSTAWSPSASVASTSGVAELTFKGRHA
jgi:hypothetical protein